VLHTVKPLRKKQELRGGKRHANGSADPRDLSRRRGGVKWSAGRYRGRGVDGWITGKGHDGAHENRTDTAFVRGGAWARNGKMKRKKIGGKRLVGEKKGRIGP